jgi:hypothetical protein
MDFIKTMENGAMGVLELTSAFVWPEFMLSVEEAGSLNAAGHQGGLNHDASV